MRFVSINLEGHVWPAVFGPVPMPSGITIQDRPRRARSTRKRDVLAAIQAATAAGLPVREIRRDGTVILGDPEPAQRQDTHEPNPWDTAFQ
jgi:hypothetical protein